MALIAIVGDVHCDIRGMYDYLLNWQERTKSKIDAIIQVGDFGLYNQFLHKGMVKYTDWHYYWSGDYQVPIPTWVNPGNHESWNQLVKWMDYPDRVNNLHLLPDGGITDILGLKVGSIWGNFSPKSWSNPSIIEQVRKWEPSSVKTMHVYKPSVERLEALGAFDMLITHDTSFGMMVSPRQPPREIKIALGLSPDEKATGCEGFNRLYESSKCKSHFFGHFHSYKVCQEANPLVCCLHSFNYNKEQAVWFWETDNVN